MKKEKQIARRRDFKFKNETFTPRPLTREEKNYTRTQHG